MVYGVYFGVGRFGLCQREFSWSSALAGSTSTAAHMGMEECEEPTLCSASSLAGAKLTNTDHGDKFVQVHVPAPALPSSNRHRNFKVLWSSWSQHCYMPWTGTPRAPALSRDSLS